MRFNEYVIYAFHFTHFLNQLITSPIKLFANTGRATIRKLLQLETTKDTHYISTGLCTCHCTERHLLEQVLVINRQAMAFLTLACERARPFGGLLKEHVTGEKGGEKKEMVERLSNREDGVYISLL